MGSNIKITSQQPIAGNLRIWVRHSSFKNLSFYESYFSNFIEGTEFIIDEAEDIIFKGKEINNRHADSQDDGNGRLSRIMMNAELVPQCNACWRKNTLTPFEIQHSRK